MNISRYLMLTELLFALMLAGLFALGTPELYAAAYFAVFIFGAIRTFVSLSRLTAKLAMLLAYFAALALQLFFCYELLINASTDISLAGYFLNRALCIIVLPLPLVVSRYVSVGKYSRFYLPSLNELATISFSELKDNSQRLIGAIGDLNRAGKSLSPENLKTILDDLPRHNFFAYINNDSLTDEYFAEAEASMDELFLYVVISNTGSAASELISVFTRKQYNHASLAFDRDLKTIISYNGGERVYPPGLNHEMLAFFNKKADATIMVYSLACTAEQKRAVLDKVREINREGSAYNMLGILLKYSHKPNIMFCSQFVYTMLQYAGLQYFDKKGGNIEPADLIEQDYRRMLKFEYEIKLNQDVAAKE